MAIEWEILSRVCVDIHVLKTSSKSSHAALFYSPFIFVSCFVISFIIRTHYYCMCYYLLSNMRACVRVFINAFELRMKKKSVRIEYAREKMILYYLYSSALSVHCVPNRSYLPPFFRICISRSLSIRYNCVCTMYYKQSHRRAAGTLACQIVRGSTSHRRHYLIASNCCPFRFFNYFFFVFI